MGTQMGVDFGAAGETMKMDPTRVDAVVNLAEAEVNDLKKVVADKEAELTKVKAENQELRAEKQVSEVAVGHMMTDHSAKFAGVKSRLEGFALASGKEISASESPLKDWRTCKAKARGDMEN